MPLMSRLMTAFRPAAGLLALAGVGLTPAWGQYAALPHASASGFQPLLIPAQSEPLVLPQPIRIPTAILPSAPGGQPALYQFDEQPVLQPVVQPAAQPVVQPAVQVAQPLQYGLPPAQPQTSVGQQQVMFWERQGQPLRLWPMQPASGASASPPQGYGQPLYPQVLYQQPVYPQQVYPQQVYPQPVYQQQVYPQPVYQQQFYPVSAPVQPALPLQPARTLQPAPPRALKPIPEFVSGKGALQGYKEAAQIAKAQLGTGHIVALIDLSEQRMTVSLNGKPWYDWPVSTGREGYRTPTGTWGVQRMHRHYKSRSYDNAPMPHAIFYHGPYAIHGTNAVKRLGRTASHGCVRLHPKNAAMLFTLVEVFGKDWLTVKVQS